MKNIILFLSTLFLFSQGMCAADDREGSIPIRVRVARILSEGAPIILPEDIESVFAAMYKDPDDLSGGVFLVSRGEKLSRYFLEHPACPSISPSGLYERLKQVGECFNSRNPELFMWGGVKTTFGQVCENEIDQLFLAIYKQSKK